MVADRDPVGELLGRLDRPVAPPARFNDDLKRRLLADLAGGALPRPEDSPMNRLRIPMDAGPIPSPAPRRVGPWRNPARRSGRALEIVAVAALVLAILGGTIAGAGGLPALLQWGQEDPAPSGATANFLGNVARTGEQPGPGPAGEPRLVWCVPDAVPLGRTPYSPIVADDLVLLSVGSPFAADPVAGGDALTAYDAGTGARRWQSLVDRRASIPAVAAGTIFVGTATDDRLAVAAPGTAPPAAPTTGALVALDGATGGERWHVPTAAPISSPPAVVDGVVYARADDGAVLAVDAETGRERWRSAAVVPPIGPDLSVPPIAAPAVAAGLVYAVGGAVVRALDAATGEERWRTAMDAVNLGTPVVDGTTLLLVSDRLGGQIAALDAATGEVRWSVGIAADRALVPAPATADGVVFMVNGSEAGELLALDIGTGQERWAFRPDFAIVSPPVVVGGVVYATSLGGSLYALDAPTGHQRWRVGVGERLKLLASPVIVAGKAYVVDAAGTLHAFDGTGASGGAATPSPVIVGDVARPEPCHGAVAAADPSGDPAPNSRKIAGGGTEGDPGASS